MATEIKFGKYMGTIVGRMVQRTMSFHDSFLTPELLAYVMMSENKMNNVFGKYFNVRSAQMELLSYIDENVPKLNGTQKVTESEFYKNMITHAIQIAKDENHEEIKVSDVISAMFDLDESFIACILDDIKNKNGLLKDLDALEDTIGDETLNFTEIATESTLQGFIDEAVNKMGIGQMNQKPNMNTQKAMDCITPLNHRELPPIIGREDVIERTVQILARANKNNPIHVGEPGVGKTTVVDGLVKRIDDGEVPDCLKNATVYSLNTGDLMVGTQFRGDLEAKVKRILSELEKDENPILYIDEIHNIMDSGVGSGGMSIASLLKPYLTTGKIKFIGATTEDEFKKIFSKDKAVARRFQKITVNEPSVSETIEILKGLKKYYEDFHHVTYKDDAIIAAAELSAKYVNDRYLPDKAIDLIDEAGAYLRTYGKGTTVKKSLIEDVLSKTCNIPKVTVENDEVSKLKVLDKEIKSNLFGQDKAVDDIVKAIKISRAGLMDDNKPIASLLMVGPTGVGKTELAKTLASTLGIGFVKFDMSEYMDKTSVNKLIGASAGYVGYEEGGALVDAIRKQPHCVLLLDEIEKAHSDVFNVLLQVMDDATLTDNQGRKADFRNVIILMTSNAGAREVGKTSIGFGANAMDECAMTEAVNSIFSPEFRNRLTGTVVFNAMDENMARLIAEKQLKILSSKMPKVKITFSDDVVDYIVKEGLKEKQYGGRSIKRIVENNLKPLFVDELLFGNLKKGGFCHITIEDDTFHLDCKKSIVNMKKVKVPQTV